MIAEILWFLRFGVFYCFCNKFKAEKKLEIPNSMVGAVKNYSGVAFCRAKATAKPFFVFQKIWRFVLMFQFSFYKLN